MKQADTSSSLTVSPLIYLRSGLFFLGMAVSALVVASIMAPASFGPFETRYRVSNLWVRFNLWSLKHLCGLSHRVYGLENIPEQNGVILAKHQSAWETVALQMIFPRFLSFLLKQELLKIPVWGWGLSKLEPIAIDRSAKSQALKQVLRDGEARLRAGRWVVVFPEGTRVAPGERGKYNASGAMLAHRAGCPVLPMAHNAGEFWRRNAFLKYPGVIQVHIGPPIDAAALSAQEVNHRAEEWIESKMLEISGDNALNSPSQA